MHDQIFLVIIVSAALAWPLPLIVLGLYKITRKEKLLKSDYINSISLSTIYLFLVICTLELMEKFSTIQIGNFRLLIYIWFYILSVPSSLLARVFMRNFAKK